MLSTIRQQLYAPTFTTLSSVALGETKSQTPLGAKSKQATITAEEFVIVFTEGDTDHTIEGVSQDDLVSGLLEAGICSSIRRVSTNSVRFTFPEGRDFTTTFTGGTITDVTAGVDVSDQDQVLLVFELAEAERVKSVKFLSLRLHNNHTGNGISVEFIDSGEPLSVVVDYPTIYVYFNSTTTVQQVADLLNTTEASEYVRATVYVDGDALCDETVLLLNEPYQAASYSNAQLAFHTNPDFASETFGVVISEDTTAAVSVNMISQEITATFTSGMTVEEFINMWVLSTEASALVDCQTASSGVDVASAVTGDTFTLTPTTTDTLPTRYTFSLYIFHDNRWYYKGTNAIAGSTFFDKSFSTLLPVGEADRMEVITKVIGGLGRVTTKVGRYVVGV